jgi:hypothetical protein
VSSTRQAAADVLEAECRRRGQHGVDQPVYYRGAVVGYTRRCADAGLLALLKAYRPDRFTVAADTRGRQTAARCRIRIYQQR